MHILYISCIEKVVHISIFKKCQMSPKKPPNAPRYKCLYGAKMSRAAVIFIDCTFFQM